MASPKQKYYEKRGQILVKNLQSRHFEAYYCADKEKALQKALELEQFPERIEAFDVSNLGATGIVAAMTVHVEGKPLKRDYRKFRIRDLEQPDDYASMYQAVYRRFRHYADGDEKFAPLPDLLLIDGGDTRHLRSAERADHHVVEQIDKVGYALLDNQGKDQYEQHLIERLVTDVFVHKFHS